MPLLPLAISEFIKKWWPEIALAVFAIGMLGITYYIGHSAGKQGEVVKQQAREIETQRDLGQANSNAADARVKDATTAVRQEKELSDALNATQDPDRQRALRGCAILRQQGRDTTHIPACR